MNRREFLKLPLTFLTGEKDEHARLEQKINIVGKQVFRVHAPILKELAKDYLERKTPPQFEDNDGGSV